MLKRDRLPYIQHPAAGHCVWVAPPSFSENEALSYLGELQKLLYSNTLDRCQLDLTRTTSADPLSLLYLGLLISQAPASTVIELDLGNTNRLGANARFGFLRFLARQGFLSAFIRYAKIFLDGEAISESVIRDYISALPSTAKLYNSDFIFAQIIELDAYRPETQAEPPGSTALADGDTWADPVTGDLRPVTDALVREAYNRTATSAFGGDRYVRDVLFQKLSKIVYELALNVVEHAYLNATKPRFGIYARIRSAKPKYAHERYAWEKLWREDRVRFGHQKFTPNVESEWVELFLCDTGVGITYSLPEAKNQLASLWNRLFVEPISRRRSSHDREASLATGLHRSNVTGLQELGTLLSLGSDFIRLYSESGVYLGGHFPWRDNQHPVAAVVRELKEFSATPISGTAYTIHLQPQHKRHPFGGDWMLPDSGQRQAVIRALQSHPKHFLEQSINVIDQRRQQRGSSSPKDFEQLQALESFPNSVLLFRPPRVITKHEVAEWLYTIVGTPGNLPKYNVKTLVLSDLSPFQAQIFLAFFKQVHLHPAATTSLMIVSEGWATVALSPKDTVDHRYRRFAIDVNRTNDFFGSGETIGLNARDLALQLRKADSEIFWDTVHGDALFARRLIVWHTDDQEQVPVLKRYLDITYALSFPEGYRAARRSLRRLLELVPELDPVADDELISGLVNDAKRTMYRADNPQEDREREKIVIGSVRVSGTTLRRYSRRRDQTVRADMSLLVNMDSDPRPPSNILSALLWLTELPDYWARDDTSAVASPQSEKPWSRLPRTPLIAPDGKHSIPLLRFKRADNGCQDFEKCFYGQTPAEMYRDLDRYGALKLGHWQQGNRHDLLTVNVKHAFEYSHLEHGHLYRWLVRTLVGLLRSDRTGKPAKAQFLLYPSHAVTETIITRIVEDAEFTDAANLPRERILPIKFLGQRTVSPWLFPPLLAERLRELASRITGTSGTNQQRSWACVVLDDGTVSRKTLSETEQYLRGLGAGRVYTVALLDRSGTPYHENLLTEYIERHPRYWRWDVPGLGNRHSCALCRAIDMARTLRNGMPEEPHKERLNAILRAWEPRSVETNWFDSGFRTVALRQAMSFKFGINPAACGEPFHMVQLNTATAAAAICVELTRMTPRMDLPFKAIAKLDNLTEPEERISASIEILAAHLVTFIDELDYDEKRARYIKLLDLLWAASTTSDATGLGVLCFALVDDDLCDDLWLTCREDYVRTRGISAENTDVHICVSFLKQRSHEQDNVRVQELPSTDEPDMSSILGVKDRVKALLDLTGDPTRSTTATHAWPLRERLERLIAQTADVKELRETSGRIVKDTAKLVSTVRELRSIGLLNGLPDGIDAKIETVHIRIQPSLDCLRAFASAEGDTGQGRDTITESGRFLKSEIFGAGGSSEYSLTRVITAHLFRPAVRGARIRTLLQDVEHTLSHRWQAIIRDRRERHDVCWRYAAQDDQMIVPRILCATQVEWSADYWLYWDANVHETVRNVLAGALYASQQIGNPYAGFRGETRGDLWWNVQPPTENDRRLRLVFQNATLQDEIPWNWSRRFLHGFKNAGGEIVGPSVGVRHIDEQPAKIVQIELLIPFHTAFL
jgi:hypothetical protein